jgi:hypothetical protein
MEKATFNICAAMNICLRHAMERPTGEMDCSLSLLGYAYG